MRKIPIFAISLVWFLAVHLFGLKAGLAQVIVVVTPPKADVTVNQTQQFTATVLGTVNQGVNWSVIPGGNGNFGPGAIDSTGLYTAPNNAPEPPFVTIKATSVADPSASDTAQVIVRDTQNFNQRNADGDLSATNRRDFVHFLWNRLPDGTTRLVLSRSLTENGPWMEVLIDEFAIDMNPIGNMIHDSTDIIPADTANDYFYKLDAYSATGSLLKSYAPVFVPKFVQPGS